MRFLQALVITLGGCLLLAAAVSAEPGANEISVNGEAQAVMVPDMAVIDLVVVREADTARAALDANSSAMEKVLEGLLKAGVEQRDLQTSDFSIQPRYVYPQRSDGEPPKLVGYTVRNGLTVRVRDLAKLGNVIDSAVSLGVNESGSVSFTNEDPSAALALARSLAVQDALAKAATLAQAANVQLGAITAISEQSYSPQPKMARMEAVSLAGAAPPMVAGENSYRVGVNLRIAIEQ